MMKMSCSFKDENECAYAFQESTKALGSYSNFARIVLFAIGIDIALKGLGQRCSLEKICIQGSMSKLQV